MKYSEYKYKFKVEENFSIELPFKIPDFEHEYASSKDGILSVKRGYAWDGASGPIINTRDTLVASLVHDVLYQAMRLNLIKPSKDNRKIADKNFFEILKMNGVNSIRRKVWYFAVRLFGKKSTIKIQENDKVKDTSENCIQKI